MEVKNMRELKDQKENPLEISGFKFLKRRERDSNSRTGFAGHTLSREGIFPAMNG